MALTQKLKRNAGETAAVSANYALPAISGPSDNWLRQVAAPITRGQPPALPTRPMLANDHTAVWTGSEMIVWGGQTIGVAVKHWREIQSQHR